MVRVVMFSQTVMTLLLSGITEFPMQLLFYTSVFC